jgi:hypothetical protein
MARRPRPGVTLADAHWITGHPGTQAAESHAREPSFPAPGSQASWACAGVAPCARAMARTGSRLPPPEYRLRTAPTPVRAAAAAYLRRPGKALQERYTDFRWPITGQIGLDFD